MSGRTSIVRSPVRTRDILLLLTIPTSAAGYEQQLKREEQHDYAVQFDKKTYLNIVVRMTDQTLPAISATGVTIVRDVTLKKFGELLSRNKDKIIILVAHWNDQSIEFFDGFASNHSIVRQIPDDFFGIIDLCVCRSKELGRLLRNSKPNISLIKFSKSDQSLRFWLIMFLAMFKQLNQHRMTYLEVIDWAFEVMQGKKK